MSKRSKSRVTIKVDGRARELFSVRETPHGDLVIINKHSEELDFGNYHGRLIEQRFSVHPSPKTAGYTLTQRLRFDDGSDADTYSHVRPVGNRFCWIIMGRACASLHGDRYVTGARNRDTVYTLGSYDPSKSVLAYVTVVTDLEANIRHELSSVPLNVRSIRFTKFTLWFLYGFINLPSSPQGAQVVLSTKSPRLNGELQRGAEPDGVSLSHDEIAPAVRQIMEKISTTYIHYMEKWFDREKVDLGNNKELWHQLSHHYTREPMWTSIMRKQNLRRGTNVPIARS